MGIRCTDTITIKILTITPNCKNLTTNHALYLQGIDFRAPNYQNSDAKSVVENPSTLQVHHLRSNQLILRLVEYMNVEPQYKGQLYLLKD